jgi:hypothetical protein
MGGKTTADNLRLLCKAHNKLTAFMENLKWQNIKDTELATKSPYRKLIYYRASDYKKINHKTKPTSSIKDVGFSLQLF